MALTEAKAKAIVGLIPATDKPSAEGKADFLRAYWQTKTVGQRDRFGNVLYTGASGQPMRVHFDTPARGTAQVQWQDKPGKSWRTVQSRDLTLVFRDAAEEVRKAAGMPSAAELEEAAAAQWGREQERRKTTARVASLLALKHATAGLSWNELVEAVSPEDFSTERPHDAFVGKLDRLLERYVGILTEGVTVTDEAFGSIDRPPLLPLLVPVGYTFSGKVDGWRAVVGIRHVADQDAMLAAMVGDSAVHGSLTVQPWGLAARVTQVKEDRRDTLDAAMALWCRLVRGYGISVWEAEPKLKTALSRLPEIVLAKDGSRLLGRCVGSGSQLGLPGMKPNRRR